MRASIKGKIKMSVFRVGNTTEIRLQLVSSDPVNRAANIFQFDNRNVILSLEDYLEIEE
jgi:hypothetical protein